MTAPCSRPGLRAGALCLVLLGACRGAEDSELRLPADVDVIALLSPDGGTQLRAWQPGAPLPVVTDGVGPHRLYGFRSADLEALGAAWQQGDLRAATGCEATLPAPAWTGEIVGGGLTPTNEPAPPLTVDGLRDTCPMVAGWYVDLRGARDRCPTTVTGPGCRLEVAAECGLGQMQGWLHPDGGFCLEHTRGEWGCEGPATDQSPSRCEGEDVDVQLVAVSDAPPPFEARTVAVHDGPAYAPELWDRSKQIQPWHLAYGQAFELAVLEDRVVVAHARAGDGGECRNEDEVAPAFTTFDPETLDPITTVDAAPCTRDLLPTPDRRGFFATYFDLDARAYFVGRFDIDGTLVTGVPIPDAPARLPGPRGLIYEPERDTLTMFLPRQPEPALAVEARASSLEWVRTATLTGVFEIGTAIRLEPGVAIMSTGLSRYAFFDTETMRTFGVGEYPADNVLEGRFLTALPGAANDTTLISNRLGGGGLMRLRDRTPTVRLPLQDEFHPTQLLPFGDGRWLVGGIHSGQGDGRTIFALFDPVAERFEPGLWAQGQGVAAEMTADARGRIWVLHPWTGHLTRLTPR